jgi:hypothetical protein
MFPCWLKYVGGSFLINRLSVCSSRMALSSRGCPTQIYFDLLITLLCQTARWYSRLWYEFEFCCNQDDSFVNGVRSDSGATEQVPTGTSSHQVQGSRPLHEQVMFTSVKVKCEVEVSWCVPIDMIVTRPAA